MSLSSKYHEIRSVKDTLDKIGRITNQTQTNIDFKQLNFMINNELEFKISILFGIWLVLFFNDFKRFKSSFEILEKIRKKCCVDQDARR